MKYHAVRYWLWLAVMAMVLAGCQSSDETAVDGELTAGAATSAPAVILPAPKSSAQSKENKARDAAVAAVAQYTPPFPDRLDMFEPPKRAQGAVRRDDEDSESVVLMGFVNVDQPRAILSIDGVIAPIQEGSQKYGVQVHVIQPPTVVLERGRRRWTATLE
jgi:hypothetical protein